MILLFSSRLFSHDIMILLSFKCMKSWRDFRITPRLTAFLTWKIYLFRFAECLCEDKNSSENWTAASGEEKQNIYNARVDTWTETARKIKILYDPTHDYHPQYEGFDLGTEIKQADTVLVGYPLMFSMNQSTRTNDLKIYGDATRGTGPAMSNSMYAINYLDIDDIEAGNEMFLKSYQPYLRQPFNVWSEVAEGESGATNFITGAGGFLQTILNGFLGIRVRLNHLEIRRLRLPRSLTKLQFNGISYLSSKFQLSLDAAGNFISFTTLNDDLSLKIDNDGKLSVRENVSCK